MMPNNNCCVFGDDATKASTPSTASRDPPEASASLISAAIKAAQSATEIPFAQKVMNMINDGRFRGVLGWSADGESFSILKRDVFKARVLPAYFGSIQLKSFKKRLSRHGFETRQVYTLGREDTAFFHPNFIRDRPELCVLIVPLGTTKANKKRVREEVATQPSDKPSFSFSPSLSDGNSLQAYQPSLPATTAPVEMPPQGQEQTKAPTEDVSMAAASLCAVSRQTNAKATTNQQSWSEPAAKRLRDTNNATTQEVSMGAQYEHDDAGSTIATTQSDRTSPAATRSDSSPMETINAVHPGQVEAVRSQDENEDQQRVNHTQTAGRDQTTHTEAAPPQGHAPPVNSMPPQVLSTSPDVKRASQSEGDECSVTPHDEQGAVDSSVKDSGNDEGQRMCEDGLGPTGCVQEEERTEGRAWNTIQNADGCGGIHHADDKKVGRAEAPSEQQVLPQDHGSYPFSTAHSSSASMNTALLQTVQQHWLQSELQAAAMSAQAAFFRELFLRIRNAHGSSGILGGASCSPSQQGSMDLLQQKLQVALGSFGKEGGFLNGVTQQVVNLGGPHVFPDDSEEKEERRSCNLHRQTSLGHSGVTGDQMSSAQDPVSIVLEMASSMGLKFSAPNQA